MVRIANHPHPRGSGSTIGKFQTNRIVLFRILVIIIGISTILSLALLLQLSFQFTHQPPPGFDSIRGIHGSSNHFNDHKNIPDSKKKINENVDMAVLNSKRTNVEKVIEKSDQNSKDVSNSAIVSNAAINHQFIHPSCPYMRLTDLTEDERHPQKSNRRHMVTPPKDGNVTLVCCHTTAGPWNIMVHTQWAPIGSQRFLQMVSDKYFDTTVPLMRCIPNFICQFGLNGIPTAMKPYIGKNTLPDDPNWLPEGPTHRTDPLTNIKRFNRGYLAYAGAGKHSRDIQFIVALQDNGPLGGGSPWEVPWGELVGNHSYETLSRIYTGYGENGPSQGLLHKADALTVVKEKYPLLDYIQSCYITDSDYADTAGSNVQ